MSHQIDFAQLKAHVSIQDIVEKLHLDFTQKGKQLQGNYCFFLLDYGFFERNLEKIFEHT